MLLAVCAPALASAQQQATITGRVTAAQGGAPLPESRVFVVGTNQVASTNAEGRYTLRVSPGTFDVRVIRVGYTEQKRQLTVTAGATQSLDFALNASVVRLTEIVTTATGQQARRVELGNQVTTLGNIAEKVETAPVSNLADLMVAKAPGVQVLAGNMTGAAPVVRIRGIKSLSLSSAPIYVIDGVRMSSGAVEIGTAGSGNGTAVSYLNALNPEEIADIEIVKGPSAATLYGTDAANGVIVITTKKGMAGPARWTAHVGGGLVKDQNDYPTQYAVWGHAFTATPPYSPIRCRTVTTVPTVAGGNPACVADSVTSYNLLEDPDVSPIGTGKTQSYGAQVSGGSDQVRYFVSGDFEAEKGVLQLPPASSRYLISSGAAIKPEWQNPEYFGRTALRANLNATINPKLDLSVNTGYIRTGQRLPQVDNNTWSYIFQAYGNPGFKPTLACQTTPVNCLSYTNKGGLGEELGGYAQYLPAHTFQAVSALNIDRFLTSATAAWRPLEWIQTNATIGMDQGMRENVQKCLFGECPYSGSTSQQGYVYDSRAVDRNISAKFAGTGTWNATQTMNFQTTFGADYTNRQFEYSSAEGDNLPPGAQTAQAGAVQFANSSFIQADKTLGYYVQEQLALRDRLFLTGALRTDQNSAFGTKFQRVVYPKASVSYIVSDEPWFPRLGIMNSLRLRGAYGASGVQPNSTTALQTFAATKTNLPATTTAVAGVDQPGLLASALGNPELKPERSTEREMGFEARFFDRINLDFTYYNNVTKDALIAQPIASSAGPSSLSVTRNLGSVRNTGLEATVNATLFENSTFGWNMTVGGSHNSNKIESLGLQPCVVNTTDCVSGFKPNPTIGTGSTRDSLGLPIRGVFYRPYTYSDANGDGVIARSEIVVDTGFVYAGYSIPRDLVTIQNTFDLFNRKLSLNFLLDYKGGFSLFNSTTNFLCSQKDTCYDETHADIGATSTNPVLTSGGTVSLDKQARAVAARFAGANNNLTTTAGFWENGQFWRLREIGATLTVPQNMSNYLNARDASITFAARNLKVWTAYTGSDPESNFATGNVQTDLLTTAPRSYYQVRLNLHF